MLRMIRETGILSFSNSLRPLLELSLLKWNFSEIWTIFQIQITLELKPISELMSSTVLQCDNKY